MYRGGFVERRKEGVRGERQERVAVEMYTVKRAQEELGGIGDRLDRTGEPAVEGRWHRLSPLSPSSRLLKSSE